MNKTTSFSGKKKNFKLIFCVSVLILIFVFAISVSIGKICFTPSDILTLLFRSEQGIYSNIFFYSRLPRAIASLFAGIALSVSGCILQSVLSNKLASPGIIGVNAGAGLGITICCASGLLSSFSTSAFSFIGAIISILMIMLFSKLTYSSKSSVILGGVALNSILNALSESISSLNSDISILTTEFRVGGFSSVSYGKITPALIIISISLIFVFSITNELDVISDGDEAASSVGLNVKKYRIIFLCLSALLASSAVSYSGLLGFIGLIVPHFVRKTVGNESKKLLPIAAIWGGIFLCFCDFLSRILFYPYEIPVGIITAIIGGPLFVFILFKKRKDAFYD